jgi:hypothetical protein
MKIYRSINQGTDINKDKLSTAQKEKIIWYDIDKDGHIDKRLNKQPVVYLYKYTTENQIRYYVGSSVNILNRMSNHRYGVIA